LSYAGHCLAAEPDLPCDNLNDPNSLSTLCGFAKPEDVQFIASKSAVIVSEQGWKQPDSGGFISIVDVDGRAGRLGTRHALWPPAKVEPSHRKLIGDPSCVIAPVTPFAPHGIGALDQGQVVRVAVVNHAGREAIELFDLRGAGQNFSLEWRGCVPLPPDTAGNDVTIHPDGRLFVSNYCPSVHDDRAMQAVFAALRKEVTGDVMEWSPKNGWRHLPNTQMAMSNGIILDAPRNRLFVAELGKRRVVEFELEPDGGVEQRAEFAFRDLADDLNWTARGTILVGGQTWENLKGWSVAEIDPKTGVVRSLFEGQKAIHSVTSATDIGGAIVFGSTNDQRIAIAKWPL
jgi:hypothetical protein